MLIKKIEKIEDRLKIKENAAYIWLDGKKYTVKEAIKMAVKEMTAKL